MIHNVILGIDTSNYTTALALVDFDGKLVYQGRQVLDVKKGNRGLRQSEALFQHVVNLPVLMQKMRPQSGDYQIKGIAVSAKPRPVKDSYMPVFRAGIGLAESLACTLNVPLFYSTHQEGHIRAALYGAQLKPSDLPTAFLATHFSGGTSELLAVKPHQKGYACDILGKTLDLNAGQLVDRIGVALGCSFPAGKALEGLAEQATLKNCVIPSSVSGMDFHFSGQEANAKQWIQKGVSKEEIAFGLLKSIAKTLSKIIQQAAKETALADVLFSGGVMSNQIIRQMLEKKFDGVPIRLHFTAPEYATDNAVGIAYIGLEQR